jgi:ribulose-5-phosphate 4-epimerase/fuculose-1-phosphate aldolase
MKGLSMLQQTDFTSDTGIGDYSAQEWDTRVDLAAMFRLSAHYGWSDTVWGHISARVPGGKPEFLMHRFGLMNTEVCASNLIKVDIDGRVIEGPADINVAGFVIQSSIHSNHPDNHFVMHSHAQEALAATIFDEDVPFLVQDSAMLYGKVRYHDWEGESVELEERERIAEALGDGKCLIMRNHGFLTVGKTAGEAFMNMFYLIRMCRVALDAKASGMTLRKIPDSLWQKAHEQYEQFPPGLYEWPVLLRQCDRLDPSYKN